MQNTNIFLIRHGDLENPRGTIYDGTISLSDLGRRKMRALGRTLRERGATPDAIVSSDFLRAMQSSVEIMSNYPDLNLLIEPDPRLQDPDSPDMFGRSLVWLAEIVDPYTHPDLQNLRIERPPSFTARMVAAIKDVLAKHQGKTVFVVSHGDPTAFAMWQLLNPGKSLPSLRELKNESGRVAYLEKGEAWRILFDDQGNVVDHEHIPASRKE
jgi:broad specificity phosphatase PhoE